MRGLNCSSMGRWAVALMVILGVGFIMTTAPVLAAESASPKKTAAGAAVTSKPYEKEINRFARQGYYVVGPLQVVGRSQKTLILFGGIKRIMIDLADKKITVKDRNGALVSLDNLKTGRHVYVCRKGNAVNVYLVKAPGRAESVEAGKPTD